MSISATTKVMNASSLNISLEMISNQGHSFIQNFVGFGPVFMAPENAVPVTALPTTTTEKTRTPATPLEFPAPVLTTTTSQPSLAFFLPETPGFIPNFETTHKTYASTNNATASPNSTISTNQPIDRAFYGFPAFCSNSAPVLCADVQLNQCNQCNMAAAGFFIFIVVGLALAIILGNLLVVILFAKDKSAFTGGYGKIKASLAVADMLTGVLLLGVAMPNILMTLNSTANDLLQYAISVQGSPLASAGGVFYVFIHTSSLYHLAFLCQQRYYAVRWPIAYKQKSMRSTYIGLVAVWAIAGTCAVSPLWFPMFFTFGYQQLIFLFNLTLAQITVSPDYSPLIVMVVLVFILPFLTMTILTAFTGCQVAEHMKQSSKLHSISAARNREVMVFATLAAMQIGFTLTLVPLIVVVILTYSGDLNTDNIAAPYVICFYVSMSNSLVNVLVYSVVDKKFRKSVKELFCACCPEIIRKRVAESSVGTYGHKPTQSTMLSKKGQSSKSSPVASV